MGERARASHGLSVMDDLYQSGGASAVLEVSRGKGPRAALAVVWSRLRGVDLQEAGRREGSEAGFDDTLRFVRYAWSGAARQVLGALLGPGDRRAVRIVCRQWCEFMDGAVWRREEEEAQAAVLSMFGPDGPVAGAWADAAAIAFSGGRRALLRGMGLCGVLEREAERRKAESARQGYTYDEVIQIGPWRNRGWPENVRVLVPRLLPDAPFGEAATAAGLPWPY